MGYSKEFKYFVSDDQAVVMAEEFQLVMIENNGNKRLSWARVFIGGFVNGCPAFALSMDDYNVGDRLTVHGFAFTVKEKAGCRTLGDKKVTIYGLDFSAGDSNTD